MSKLKTLTTLSFLISLFALNGCGQKGALYIPDNLNASAEVQASPDTEIKKTEDKKKKAPSE